MDGSFMNLEKALSRAKEQLEKKLGSTPFPELLVVLGSGFGDFISRLEVESTIDLREIENFPVSGVPGHRSELLIGKIVGTRIAVQSGRVHLYEGFSADDVVFGLRVYHRLGVKKLLLTNAAGSLTEALPPGAIVAISDHINLTGVNCLAGRQRFSSTGFISMNQCYSPRIRALMKEIPGVHEGVYAGVLGPSFETQAEAIYLEKIGADIVGMSTIQEAICARHLAIEVAGLSFVTNAAGASTSHSEVLQSGEKHRGKLIGILEALLPII
jgi:purine-nucleoside phosphorylase